MKILIAVAAASVIPNSGFGAGLELRNHQIIEFDDYLWGENQTIVQNLDGRCEVVKDFGLVQLVCTHSLTTVQAEKSSISKERLLKRFVSVPRKQYKQRVCPLIGEIELRYPASSRDRSTAFVTALDTAIRNLKQACVKNNSDGILQHYHEIVSLEGSGQCQVSAREPYELHSLRSKQVELEPDRNGLFTATVNRGTPDKCQWIEYHEVDLRKVDKGQAVESVWTIKNIVVTPSDECVQFDLRDERKFLHKPVNDMVLECANYRFE